MNRQTWMKLLEINKGSKKITTATGDENISDPIEIKFVIDEKDFLKLKEATQEYKWSIYEALSIFCKSADTLIPEMEYNLTKE